MAALGGGEEGRKEKTKSLPPPPDRIAQRWWRNLTERWKKTQRKNLFSGERRELFGAGDWFLELDELGS